MINKDSEFDNMEQDDVSLLQTASTDAGNDPQPDEPHGVPTIPQLLIAIAILVVVIGSSYVPQYLFSKEPTVKEVERIVTPQIEPEVKVQERRDAFEDVALEAKAAYVWDITEQRALFNKNGHAQLPLASLTKLMTALVAHDVYGENTVVPITLKAIEQDGENGFHDGDLWNSKELLGFTLMTSSNDGAYALAAAAGEILKENNVSSEEAFLKRMNTKAEQIGLSQTYYMNPTGLDATDIESGSYGSARDMAFLMEYILRKQPELLSDTSKLNGVFYDEAGNEFVATNTNQAVNAITGLLGSKTGYTLLAGGNLVVAFDAGVNHPIVVSVLGSSREGRFADVMELIARTEKSLMP